MQLSPDAVKRYNHNGHTKSHFLAFKKIKSEYPGLDFGNRTGHIPNFSKLPALKKNGKPLKTKHFIKRVEHQLFCLFKQHYKILFTRCPDLAAATQGDRMRSEMREGLYLTAAIIARNTDLTTMQLDQSRTVTELARFANHALSHHSRRLSPERLFNALGLLRDSGLIFYRIPPAELAGEQWQAAPAQIAFTNKFWHLLGISKEERLQQKNKAKHELSKKVTAGDRVAQRRFADKLQAAQRKTRAAAAAANQQQAQATPTPADQPQSAQPQAMPDNVHKFFNTEIGNAYAAGNTAAAERLQQQYQALKGNPAQAAAIAEKLKQQHRHH